jgi:HAD superfamily hydrolase (TIGR01509 family)
MDGVLVDSYQAHLSAWQLMLPNHGLRMTEEQFASTFGQTNAEIFASLYPSLNPVDYPSLSEEKEAAYREIISLDFPEMDGAAELLDALNTAGAKLAIGSSGPPENVQAVLNVLPAGEYIKTTTDASDITRSKPDPEVFLKAALKIELPPERCAVIEDAPAGVKAGKAAGCAVVAITGTAPRQDLCEADLIVDSLRELTPDNLKSLIGQNRIT